MTNAELLAKIKAEIERQRKFIEGMFIEGDNNFYDGQDDAYNNILTFLSTLESEKPTYFDFNYEFSHFLDKKDEELGSTTWSEEDLQELARHFAQWGADHAKIDVTDFCKPIDPGIAQCIADHFWEMLGEDEKPVPNDLEEAAKNHIRKVVDAAGHPGWDWTTQDIAEAFIAGAKWQAKHMKDEKEKE